MAPPNTLQPQKALGPKGGYLKDSPLYERTPSIKEVHCSRQLRWRMSWAKKEWARKGFLRFVPDDERGSIQSNRMIGDGFHAIFLEKVYSDAKSFSNPTVPEEFYPPLYKFLQGRQNWGTDFQFRGLADFLPRLMEWTEHIMSKYARLLRQTEIYGLVAVSRFPYMYDTNVWRAFCELWGPLTNTFHHAGGELGISLNDLKVIGGLPILGEPYEEFLPPNEELSDATRYPPTVLELLRIHASLCKHLNEKEVSWQDWMEHFFRGEQAYDAFGEELDVGIDGRGLSQPGSSSTDGVEKKVDLLPLRVSKDGALAAFLSFMLSRFVFPHGRNVVRPETFVMASLMAKGRKISLAPSALGHIYHGLNQMATHKHPGRANPNFGMHFVIGWMAEYFPCLYRTRPDDEYPGYPRLAQYAGVIADPFEELFDARVLLRHSKHVNYRAIPFGIDLDMDNADLKDTSDRDFEYLLCIRSSVLPVRVGGDLILEPYYPNRFGRQSGFDQGIPSNSLKFKISKRSHRSLHDIAQSYARFFKRNSGVEFHVPHSLREGICTSNYCRWWVVTTGHYLSQSINKVNVITCSKPQPRKTAVVIKNIRKIVRGLRGAVKISSLGLQAPGESSAQPTIPSSSYKRPVREESSSDDVNFKRKKSKKSSESPESVLRDEVHNNPNPISPLNPASSHTSEPHIPAAVVNASDGSNGSNSEEQVDFEPTLDPEFGCDNVAPTDLEVETPVPTSAIDSGALTIVPEVHSSKPTQAPLEITPLDMVTSSLRDMFSPTVKEHVRQAFRASVQAVAETMSKAQSTEDLLSVKNEILEDLKTLKLMAQAAKISELNLSWIVTQVYNFSEGASTIAKLTGEEDTMPLSKVSHELDTCKAKIDSKEAELSQLHEKSLTMKEREKKILDARAKLRQMEQSFVADKEVLDQSTSEVEQCIQLQKARRADLEEIERASRVKLEELKLKKGLLQDTAAAFTSFASSG